MTPSGRMVTFKGSVRGHGVLDDARRPPAPLCDPDVPAVRGHGVLDNARLPVVQGDVIDYDGGLAAVVDDPVVADDLRHAAAVEVQVDEQLGRVSRREDRDSRLRADTALGPDVDLAVTLEKNARRVVRATKHALVHHDRL